MFSKLWRLRSWDGESQKKEHKREPNATYFNIFQKEAILTINNIASKKRNGADLYYFRKKRNHGMKLSIKKKLFAKNDRKLFK